MTTTTAHDWIATLRTCDDADVPHVFGLIFDWLEETGQGKATQLEPFPIGLWFGHILGGSLPLVAVRRRAIQRLEQLL